MLGTRVVEVRVLDLYAGSGALGLEALSRGASGAVLVDADSEAIRAIGQNVKALSYQDRTVVKKMRAERFVQEAVAQGLRFTVIFCDPPWIQGLSTTVQGTLHRLLKPGGVILVEHQKADAPPVLDQLIATRDRAWGDTQVTWYQEVAKGVLT